jgi:CheY-like chemotaxis protein
MEIRSNDTGFCVLIADDDPDDQYMLREALAGSEPVPLIHTVNDGEALIDFLHKRGTDNSSRPTPDVILLDLNMPKKDGRECLREIKHHPEFRKIPIVVFSTSNNQDDVTHSYEAGANSYISKPYSYNELVELMTIFKQYWMNKVKTPVHRNER